jgi:hypothetical protein
MSPAYLKLPRKGSHPWPQPAFQPRHKADVRLRPTNPPIIPGLQNGRNAINEKALPFSRAFRFSSLVVCLAWDYIGRTWTFLALSDLELNLLAFIERSIARCLDIRVVDKQIFAAIIWINKAKTLACIEPFHCTCTHLCFSLTCLRPPK